MADGVEQPATKKKGCGFWILVAVAVLIGLAVLGAIVGPKTHAPAVESDATSDDAADSAVEPSAPAEEENPPEMSAAEFAALRTGMSYEDAVAVIGSPGELISENELGGIRTSMYQWEGEGGFGANANAMFQNGELIQKSQFGLE